MKKQVFLVIILGLLLLGCSNHVAPQQGASLNNTHTIESSGVNKSIQTQGISQSIAHNSYIQYIHSYSPGHSYKILLPSTWQGKYWVQETHNSTDTVNYYFYKPLYVTSEPSYNEKVAQNELIFSIDMYQKSKWIEQEQSPASIQGDEVIATRGNLVFVVGISLSNPYEGQLANEFQQMAGDINNISKTFEFVDEQ